MTPTARYSAMSLGSPWRGLCTLPGADPAEARPAVMFLYAGLAITVAPLPPQDYTVTFRAPLRPRVLAARDRTPAFTAPDRRPEFIATVPRRRP